TSLSTSANTGKSVVSSLVICTSSLINSQICPSYRMLSMRTIEDDVNPDTSMRSLNGSTEGGMEVEMGALTSHSAISCRMKSLSIEIAHNRSTGSSELIQKLNVSVAFPNWQG
ncbi:hypothetical protein PMAYCL1PPCAC_28882, partial [Pristionchus mayeri]